MVRILVIEEYDLTRQMTCNVLLAAGFCAQSAQSVYHAAKLAQKECPELVMLDIDGRGLGMRALEQLRADQILHDVPVILLTAAADRASVIRARELRVRDFILKGSVKPGALTQRVKAVYASLTGGPSVPFTRVEVSPPAAPPKPADPHPKEALAPLDHKDVLARINAEVDLRPVPGVLQHVVSLTNSRHSSIKDLSHAIQNDHALAVKVLRVANSSSAGAGKRASSISEAVQRVGMGGVRNIAGAILTMTTFESSACPGVSMQKFWEHSLVTAILSEILADELDVPGREEMYLAGLFHDLGRLVLGTKFPAHYREVLETAEHGNDDLTAVERRMFGLTHADATRQVLKKWNCTSHLTDAAALHDIPNARLKKASDLPPSVLVLALANAVAHATLRGDSGNAAILPVYPLANALKLSGLKLRELVEKGVQQMQETKILLSLHDSTSEKHAEAGPPKATVNPDIRVVTFCQGNPADELTLWADALGIMETEAPTTAIIRSVAMADARKHLAALEQIEAKQDRQMGILLLHAPGEPTSDVFKGRTVTRVQSPFWYSRLISALNGVEAVARVHRAAVTVSA